MTVPTDAFSDYGGNGGRMLEGKAKFLKEIKILYTQHTSIHDLYIYLTRKKHKMAEESERKSAHKLQL